MITIIYSDYFLFIIYFIIFFSPLGFLKNHCIFAFMKDVIIIGAGPIGLACGIAAQRQLDYLILEKGQLVNSLYYYPQNMTFFSTSDRLEIGEIPFISHNPKPTRAEALEYYRRVTSTWELNVNLYEGVDRLKKLKRALLYIPLKGATTKYCYGNGLL